MKLSDVILEFPKQFADLPTIQNGEGYVAGKKFLVAGMGGSNLATDFLKSWHPELDIVTHRDYNLPQLADLEERTIIASSYSGNTEETVDALKEARARGLKVVVIASGGTLLETAQQEGIPYIAIPATGIQPRFATGYLFMALLALIQDESLSEEALKLASFDTSTLETLGTTIGDALADSIPVIYAATRNEAVARNWKIQLNENAKTPAFFNVFPELNHNEMCGVMGVDVMAEQATPLHFVFLTDEEDHPHIQKRMQVLKEMLGAREGEVEEVALVGRSRLEKLLYGLVLGQWMSVAVANAHGVDPEPVLVVEEFKKQVTIL